MKKTGLYNESVEIDEELRALIKVMNELDWIETTGCCVGHPGDLYHRDFYIMLFCDMKKINAFAEILDKVQEASIETDVCLMLKCEFLFIGSVSASQLEAPKGSISLQVSLECLPDFEIEDDDKLQKDKLYFVEMLTKAFKAELK